MKHFFQAFGGIFLAGSLTVSAQQSAGLQYGEAVRAFQRGDSVTVVKVLEPVVHSAELKGVELGRVWLLLGASYRAVGKYHSAQLAYGNATLLLKDDPLAVKAYEVLLRESGDFYREMGDFASAERLENKSLQLSEENQDHTAIARACQSLAELFLDRGELRKGERFVSRAGDEARLTSEFDEDDRAYLAQLQGWVALKRRDTQSAISDYLQAVDLFTGRYGDNFALTGWGYVLLADAYDQQGLRDKALDEMRKGITILGRTAGTHDARYAAAEIRYAKLLSKMGRHSLATKLQIEGEATIREVHQTQCVGCTMNVTAFR